MVLAKYVNMDQKLCNHRATSVLIHVVLAEITVPNDTSAKIPDTPTKYLN